MKLNRVRKIILPNRRMNIFCLSLLFLGIILGSIFANMISINDKNLVIEKINSFITSINDNSINNILVFKNSIGINLLYIFIIFILGMTLLGIIFSILLLCFKGFTLGFSLASFFITYHSKGIILAILYLLLGEIINIFLIFILTVYAINFTKHLILLIFKNENSAIMKRTLKNYFIILLFSLLLVVISSLLTSFLLPAIIKLIIRLYI